MAKMKLWKRGRECQKNLNNVVQMSLVTKGPKICPKLFSSVNGVDRKNHF